jgi:hypothetical protein
VTSLRSGGTWFNSPNWTTGPALVQSVHSVSMAMLCVHGLPVFITKGKDVFEVERKSPYYADVENEWSCTSLKYYESILHCLMKHSLNLSLIST